VACSLYSELAVALRLKARTHQEKKVLMGLKGIPWFSLTALVRYDGLTYLEGEGGYVEDEG